MKIRFVWINHNISILSKSSILIFFGFVRSRPFVCEIMFLFVLSHTVSGESREKHNIVQSDLFMYVAALSVAFPKKHTPNIFYLFNIFIWLYIFYLSFWLLPMWNDEKKSHWDISLIDFFLWNWSGKKSREIFFYLQTINKIEELQKRKFKTKQIWCCCWVLFFRRSEQKNDIVCLWTFDDDAGISLDFLLFSLVFFLLSGGRQGGVPSTKWISRISHCTATERT